MLALRTPFRTLKARRLLHPSLMKLSAHDEPRILFHHTLRASRWSRGRVPVRRCTCFKGSSVRYTLLCTQQDPPDVLRLAQRYILAVSGSYDGKLRGRDCRHPGPRLSSLVVAQAPCIRPPRSHNTAVRYIPLSGAYIDPSRVLGAIRSSVSGIAAKRSWSAGRRSPLCLAVPNFEDLYCGQTSFKKATSFAALAVVCVSRRGHALSAALGGSKSFRSRWDSIWPSLPASSCAFGMHQFTALQHPWTIRRPGQLSPFKSYAHAYSNDSRVRQSTRPVEGHHACSLTHRMRRTGASPSISNGIHEQPATSTEEAEKMSVCSLRTPSTAR
ncbi:hypothetical protein R3P38DRAFT_1364619 [Favolaschia claudopus]|uniref:Uncharacterized protein n=1 Tax=Favolaschia claudopus TaxID=2862362 RepID=A0AAW0DVA9_9AGAR